MYSPHSNLLSVLLYCVVRYDSFLGFYFSSLPGLETKTTSSHVSSPTYSHFTLLSIRMVIWLLQSIVTEECFLLLLFFHGSHTSKATSIPVIIYNPHINRPACVMELASAILSDLYAGTAWFIFKKFSNISLETCRYSKLMNKQLCGTKAPSQQAKQRGNPSENSRTPVSSVVGCRNHWCRHCCDAKVWDTKLSGCERSVVLCVADVVVWWHHGGKPMPVLLFISHKSGDKRKYEVSNRFERLRRV